jgi:uncharacterized protein YecT (DUF1311 family)
MKYGLTILLLVMSLAFVLPVYPSDDLCSYCGVWVPFSGNPTYSFNDRLTITEQTIALPGCSPAKTKQVLVTYKADYRASEEARLKPLKTVLKIEEPMKCVRHLPGLSNGALVEIQLRPRGYEDSEEIALELFDPNNFEALKDSYTEELIHTPPGEMQMVKRPPSPVALGRWWFIRERYDPCFEGAGRGVWICSALKHKKADELLNSEWRRLLTVIMPEKKRSFITTQKKWLKACESKCAQEGVKNGGYHPWPLAMETYCLANYKTDRAKEIESLYECINHGKGHCPKLKSIPNKFSSYDGQTPADSKIAPLNP